MKKLINDPKNVVIESMEGLCMAHPALIKAHYEPDFIYRADAPLPGKVGLISGGGSGHEPLHTGFVGHGMLTAACPGAVFTSPTPDQMAAAAKWVDSGSGVLFIVKNYSGDVMNFNMGADLARMDGVRTLSILIDDDVAVKDSLFTQGRRGVGTTVLAEKIVGAAAERGYDLPRLAELGCRVNTNGRSLGIALTSCTVPAVGRPTFVLGEGEMEFGIGIHGEPGRERISMRAADEITERMVLSILEDGKYERSVSEWNEETGDWVDRVLVNEPFHPGDRVLAFVNSMGGTPDIELPIVFRKLREVCQKKGLEIVRSLMGRYITSLDMAGCSITLLRVDNEMVDLWDDPVFTPALRWKM